jgi:hypothetical protein
VAQPIVSNRIGLVVVHGIGDPSAGETLRELTDALEAEDIASFDDIVRERRLGDLQTRDDRFAFFPVHIRTGVLKDHERALQRDVIAAEVFWGSASQLAPGKWGVLQGTVSLLLNVPTLVMGARGEKSLVTFLSWWASMLLASAAFALNAVLMLTLGTYIALCHMVGAPPGRWELAAPIVAAAVTFGFSWSRWLWFKEACIAFRVVGPVCLVAWAYAGGTLEHFSSVTVPVLKYTILLVATLVLLVGAAFIGERLRRTRAPESLTATLTLCLQFGLWTLIVPLAWQGLFAMIPEGGQPQWMSDAFGAAAESNGLQWWLALVVMAAFAVVTAVRWRQADAAERQVEESQVNRVAAASSVRPAERLILHPVLAVTLFICVMLGAAVVLLGTMGSDFIAPVQALARRFNNPKLAGAAIVIVPLVATQLRQALDLAYDVMFYLYYATEPGRRLLSRSRESDRGDNPVRSRFHSVVNYLVDEERVGELVILAHSQGTVIALDELAHSWSADRRLPLLRLVTFGSPITQLYQYYFPHFYPHWKSDQWMVLFSRLHEWNNFYRLDDYVGTTIDPPPALQGSFHQEAVGLGGHTGYWRDRRFLIALKRQVFDATSVGL